MSEEYEYVFKVIVIGDSGVGKSNIFSRFMKNQFDRDSMTTIGVDFSSKTLKIRNEIVKAQVWDTAGQDQFRSLAKCYYKGAIGALLVYDISNYESFKNIEKWLAEAKDHADEHLVTLLIGNKSDLEERRAVKIEEGMVFAKAQGFGFLETSAKNNLNVEEAFTRLLEEVFDKLEKVSNSLDTKDENDKKDGKQRLEKGENLHLDKLNRKGKTKDGNCAC